jgi:AcrR family transcriptional regulator
MSTARRTRAETAQETADRLIATARRVFAAEGAATASLDALAAEAGVTRGALHHHFTNKAGLFEAVFRREIAAMGARLDAVWEADMARGTDRWDAFRHTFHAYLDDIVQPGLRRILLQDGPSILGVAALDILLEQGFGVMVDDLKVLGAAGRVAALDPVAMAHLFNGATINLAFWAAEAAPGEDRLARAHAALNAMFDGFTKG